MNHLSTLRIISFYKQTFYLWRYCINSIMIVCDSHSVVSDSLWLHWVLPTRLLCPCDFPGKNTRVSCHFLLQRIFLTQGPNPGLLHFRQTLLSEIPLWLVFMFINIKIFCYSKVMKMFPSTFFPIMLIVFVLIIIWWTWKTLILNLELISLYGIR